MTEADPTRRKFVTIAGSAALAALAGCTGNGGSDDDTTTAEAMGDEMTTTESMQTTESMNGSGSMDGTTTESMNGSESMETTTESMETTTESMEETTTEAMMSGHQLTLAVQNLPQLQQGTYEGWAIYGSEKVSTGTFSVEDDLTFTVEDRDLRRADKIVVTIEPEDDPSPKPSGVVVLAGSVEDGRASLSFPADFGDASGSYILATPTNGGMSDETSGIWFLDPEGGPSASLDLPDLPDGWVYEGWIATADRVFTTGRFASPDGPDDFDRYSGMGQAPPFPGEDFLDNAPGRVLFPLELANGYKTAVITVEPDLDGMDPTGEKPFPIKPLVGEIPEGAEPKTSYDLQTRTGTIPAGSAMIR